MDMSKYKSLFMSDTSDHLDSLERELLQLEQQPENTESINEVFRHLHSIKGMASSMGYEDMAHLAHRLEDLMSFHRDRDPALTKEEVDLLLNGSDELRKQLKAIAANSPIEPAPQALLTAVEQLVRSKKKETISLPEDDPDPELPELQDGLSNSIVFEAIISKDCSTPSVRAFLVYKRLAELGQVVESEPSLATLRAGQYSGSSIRFCIQTRRGLTEIKRMAGTLVDLEQVDIRPLEQPTSQMADTKMKVQASEAKTEAEELPARPRATTVRVNTELLDFFVDSVGELITLRSFFEDLSERLDVAAMREGVRKFGKVVHRLHDRVMEVRMVPISLLTQRLPRVCRDIASSRGKQINFEVQGENVELDRALVEALDTPVLHLLRNSVDHGIEAPEKRVAAGKDPQGKIRLTVQRSSDRVILTLSDDGQGIDPQKVLAKAEQMKIRVSEMDVLSPGDVFDLIFRPGFSTQTGVSEISGRGVGLDVVRKALGDLGGRVTVESTPGQGTTFILDMPLTLAILQVLLVELEDCLLAIPASRVQRALTLKPEQITKNGQGMMYTYGDMKIPLVDLLGLIEGGIVQADDKGLPECVFETVVVGVEDQALLALGVKHISGHREVVLKGVGSMLKSLGPFGGSAVLGDGRPVLVLDVDELIGRVPSSLWGTTDEQ
jgi:two-component system, chemotaxis family, sensor kinase CheA